MKAITQISKSYKKPISDAVVLSSILLALSFMVLDGETGYATVYAVASFWSGVLLIVTRRPQFPTRTDLHVIRFGSPVVVFGAQFLARWIWHLRGLSF